MPWRAGIGGEGNHGCGETTTSGTRRATRNIRSRMKSPAVGWELLGKSDESTTTRGRFIAARTEDQGRR